MPTITDPTTNVLHDDDVLAAPRDWAHDSTGAVRHPVDQARYWVGAGLTAFIAALIGMTGFVLAQVLHIPLSMSSVGATTALDPALYGLGAACVTLAAAALLDGMLSIAPRPSTYYAWLVSTLVLLSVLLPFTGPAVLSAQVALAVVNLAVGLVLLLLLPLAADTARRQ
jgi:hypothetical protein